MSQVVSRPVSTGKVGMSIPEIKHPMSGVEIPISMDIRGVSRCGPTLSPALTGRPLVSEAGVDLKKDSSAKSRDLRLIDRDKVKCASLGVLQNIPEGCEVKHGDCATPRLPVFGHRTNLEERDVSSSSPSRVSRTQGQARLEVDQIEAVLKDKLQHSYYDVRKRFKDNDPEGQGNVSKEALTRVLVTVLGRPVSGNTCQGLLRRLGLAHRQVIAFPEFFSYFRDATQATYPHWMDPVDRTRHGRTNMTCEQVHAYLKQKARDRFLSLADMIPQLNPGGSARILKPEFRQMLHNMNFYMSDQEFQKLWRRYASDSEDIMHGERLLHALGIQWRDVSAGTPANTVSQNSAMATQRSGRASRRTELERQHQLNIELWLKNKFREGFFHMREAFEVKDPSRTGLVSRDDFLHVLGQFGLSMERSLLAAFLSRCSVKVVEKMVPYRDFLRRFQDRGDTGMSPGILHDVQNGHPKYRDCDITLDNKVTEDPQTARDLTADNKVTPRNLTADKKVTARDLSADMAVRAMEVQLRDVFQGEFLALLDTFRKLDRLNTDVISQEEFRAAIESRFDLQLTDSQFKSFVDRVPRDDEGHVKYVTFMQQFDGRGPAPSLFGSRPDKDVSALDKSQRDDVDKTGQVPTVEPWSLYQAKDTESCQHRSPEELFRIIKDLLSTRLHEVEQRFQDLDEFNTRRLTPDRMYRLLASFNNDPEITRGEILDLWDTFITNTDKTLDYLQFVRHFGFSPGSATFCNAKLQPPRRGDADFMVRSRKLNSDSNILQDSLRAKVDYLWDDLRREFASMDPYNTGCVSKGEFTHVLTELCAHLDTSELKQLTDKFQVKNDGRISYLAFLEPFVVRKQAGCRDNIVGLLQTTHIEQSSCAVADSTHAGLQAITNKLRQKLSGDWKNLRRAFKKLDVTGNGFLSVPEFRAVLKLANVLLDEEEIYHVINEYDPELAGKIKYEQFIAETFKPDSRRSVRSQ